MHDENAEEINEKIQAKNLLSTIHEAIDKDHFILYKQRIHALHQPDFHAYEVLLRLQLKPGRSRSGCLHSNRRALQCHGQY